jgi:hypothetical protein
MMSVLIRKLPDNTTNQRTDTVLVERGDSNTKAYLNLNKARIPDKKIEMKEINTTSLSWSIVFSPRVKSAGLSSMAIEVHENETNGKYSPFSRRFQFFFYGVVDFGGCKKIARGQRHCSESRRNFPNHRLRKIPWTVKNIVKYGGLRNATVGRRENGGPLIKE